MKYVVDASVALKWVLPEAQSGKARNLRDDFQNRVHELLAPDIFPVEGDRDIVAIATGGLRLSLPGPR
jgi:hypothetical protein